jgi:hypothetical protein
MDLLPTVGCSMRHVQKISTHQGSMKHWSRYYRSETRRPARIGITIDISRSFSVRYVSGNRTAKKVVGDTPAGSGPPRRRQSQKCPLVHIMDVVGGATADARGTIAAAHLQFCGPSAATNKQLVVSDTTSATGRCGESVQVTVSCCCLASNTIISRTL